MTAYSNKELTLQEIEELISWTEGQNSDGYGEELERQPIETSDGDIYVSFWNSDSRYYIKPEQELKQEKPSLGYLSPMSG